MQSLEREKYWKTKLENERKIHEDSLKESVTTFSDFEEKMREYEEISVEIKQISAEISAGNSLTVSTAEDIKSQVSYYQDMSLTTLVVMRSQLDVVLKFVL